MKCEPTQLGRVINVNVIEASLAAATAAAAAELVQIVLSALKKCSKKT